MSTPEPDVWVVVMSHDGFPDEGRGPLVMEQHIEGATREAAMKRAAELEKRQQYGACRIARLVFDGNPS